jgi:hypothetical protein
MPKKPATTKVPAAATNSNSQAKLKFHKFNPKHLLIILGFLLAFGLGIAGSMWYFYKYIYVAPIQDWIVNPRQVAYEVKAEHGSIAKDQSKLTCMYTHWASADEDTYDEYYPFELTIKDNKLNHSYNPGQPWENTQDFTITANTAAVIQAYKVTNTTEFGGTPFTFYDYLVIDKTTGTGVSVQQSDGLFADKLNGGYITAHFVCR